MPKDTLKEPRPEAPQRVSSSAPNPSLLSSLALGASEVHEELWEEEKQPGDTSADLVMQECDRLLRELTKNLDCMPLSLRYLWKLVSQVAERCVTSL